MLAAGRSRRFGSDKRRVTVSDRLTLLQKSLGPAMQSSLPCILCLCERDREEPPPTLPGVAMHFAAGAERGMGATLASGVRYLPDWAFALVALGDMPWILPQTFKTIASVARRDRIVVPLHNGVAGHPVAFGADFFAALSRLDRDRGGRSVIDTYSEAVLELSLEDPGILADVDEVHDLRGRNS